MTLTPPPWPAPPPSRPSGRPIAALTIGLIATAVVAIADVLISLNRPAPRVATYSPGERAAAKIQFCDRYRLAVRASQIDTAPGGDIALARIAMVNGAQILETAVANPPLDASLRDAGQALALSFQTQAALASTETGTSVAWQQIVDDTNAKDEVLKALCGG
ncbi:hypothetical protein [Mycolicibacter engbaekii]|uniref:hypothetical protein n=1 Tax=Mycolicibacter engbaekii TaxID=188915 RepID=UPI00105430E1|nr:hypothetical protein [Mycolicibacter engbaekii]